METGRVIDGDGIVEEEQRARKKWMEPELELGQNRRREEK
jgi:hypothetical protein